VPLAITYTPPINVWWEVTANCGIISKVDSAYNYIYLLCNLSVADADGITYVRSISTQHLTVDNYMSLNITKTYKLVGGTTYTAMGMLGSGSGGTWTYYQGGDMLFIESKAYPR
jgi:hypothetical protein